MTVETKAPRKPTSATRSNSATAARTKPSDIKRAPRPKATQAASPAAVKAATAAVKKPVARVAASKKPAAAKTAAHPPEPFVAKTNKKGKPAKVKKPKLVRDSFTMPEPEYALIAALKKRCLSAGVPAKKSEILRAAVAYLAKLSDTSVLAAVRRLDVIKTGRPAKNSK